MCRPPPPHPTHPPNPTPAACPRAQVLLAVAVDDTSVMSAFPDYVISGSAPNLQVSGSMWSLQLSIVQLSCMQGKMADNPQKL